MNTIKQILLGAVVLLGAGYAQAGVVDELQTGYRTQGAAAFSAAAGERLWRSTSTHTGKSRSCSTCHSDDLRRPGRHATTGKTIEPMAPSVNGQRLSDAAKVEKWFKRNCTWTLGRECTVQEKGDLLEYLRQQ